MQFVNDGQLTALGVTGLTQNPGAPDLQTIAELGVPGYEIKSWFGIIAPTCTPDDIVAQLQAEVVRQSQTQKFQDALASAGLEPLVGSSDDFAAVIAAELDNWSGIPGQ